MGRKNGAFLFYRVFTRRAKTPPFHYIQAVVEVSKVRGCPVLSQESWAPVCVQSCSLARHLQYGQLNNALAKESEIAFSVPLLGPSDSTGDFPEVADTSWHKRREV